MATTEKLSDWEIIALQSAVERVIRDLPHMLNKASADQLLAKLNKSIGVTLTYRPLPHEPGTWRVTRWCCLDGLCVDCHRRGNHGDRSKRVRIVHANNILHKDRAEMYVAGWIAHEATMERE